MSRERKAEFLADCLAHMPDQPDQLQRAIGEVIDGLTLIADGGEWPRDEAIAAALAAADAAWAVDAAWAAAWAAACAARAADDAAWTAACAAEAAALAHPDPDAERARQKTKREELGI